MILIDGRVVYTPLYSGVFWDVQNVFLEDVDRIEVISGPGGTLWGSNAVNGIINVITKNSRDSASQDISSHGLLVYGGTGTKDRGFGGIRYHGWLGEQAAFRIYGMYFNKKNSMLPGGGDAADTWNIRQVGFRMDGNTTEQDELTLQGDLYTGKIGQPVNDDIAVQGNNIIGRWNRRFNEQSNIELQFYGDRTYRKIPGTFGENLATYDLDFGYRFSLCEQHDLIWGVGLRYFDDRVENTTVVAFLPPNLAIRLYTAFLQDDITVIPNRLRLALGSKFEHNDFSGFEYQPSARVSWLVTNDNVIWGSITRAVRTPSRIDRDFYVPGSPPYSFLAGGPNFTSEKLIAYEIGYRFSSERTTFDIATFYNSYNDLRSIEPGPPPVFDNGLEGVSYGGEVELNVQATDWWRVKTGYQYFEKEINLKPWSKDVGKAQGQGNDAKHRIKLHALLDLLKNLEFDLFIQAISELPYVNSSVPAYASADVRIAWRFPNGLTLSLVGQRLVATQHPEFGAPATQREIQRGMYGSLQWGF